MINYSTFKAILFILFIVFLFFAMFFLTKPIKIESCKKISNAGHMISNKEIPTSFNDNVRSTLITDKGSFIIYGSHSILSNIEMDLVECSDKHKYLKYNNKLFKIKE